MTSSPQASAASLGGLLRKGAALRLIGKMQRPEIRPAMEEKNAPTIKRRSFFSAWFFLFILGWLVFELTSQPAFGVIIVCAKFGLKDWLTAWWLYRRDPNRPRAKACAMMFLSQGLWKVACTGIAIMTFLIILLASLRKVPKNPNDPLMNAGEQEQFAGAFITVLMGISFATLAGLLGIVLAWRNRLKLWVSSDIHLARENHWWPPPDEACWGKNSLMNSIFFTLLSVMMLLIFGSICGSITLLENQALGKGGRQEPPIIFWVFFVGILIIFPAIFLGLRDFLMQKIVAQRPSDCWGKITEKIG